jgi:UDP:flavonoid glycosyltransferase YjiC (YdhE family)
MKKPSGKRITFLALGSTGDILPYAALARALLDAGYHPTFVTTQDYRPLLDKLGLPGRFVPGDAQATIAQAGANTRRLMLAFAELSRGLPQLLDLSAPWLRDTVAIVNQLPIGLYGFDLAQKLDVPHIMAAVIPLAPTADFPMMGFPSWPSRLPGYNISGYKLYQRLTWLTMRQTINRWRVERLGLPTLSGSHYLGQLRRQPVLYGFSPSVVPRPADWPEVAHVTGYWFHADEAWRPLESLTRFLDAGPKPVFIGFGSMPVKDPAATTNMVLDAVRVTRQRAIIQAGWAGLGKTDLPADVFQLEYAPYGWLFSRMAAVIHHGGSGTTAAGLRAGVPGLVTPFTFDQGYWGRRLVELGVGLPPVLFRQLTADRLAEAIDRLTNDEGMKTRAAVLGRQITAENGIVSAVRLLEGYMERRASVP